MSRKTTPTHVLLNQITLSANTSSVVIGGIPSTYADLVLLVNGPASNGFDFIRFNSNTSNYSRVGMGGNGSTTISFAAGDSTAVDVGMGVSHRFSYTINVMDYSATDKHKTVLLRGNVPEGTANQPILAGAYRWGDTSAITSITFSTGGAYVSGTSFSLYGVYA